MGVPAVLERHPLEGMLRCENPVAAVGKKQYAHAAASPKKNAPMIDRGQSQPASKQPPPVAPRYSATPNVSLYAQRYFLVAQTFSPSPSIFCRPPTLDRLRNAYHEFKTEPLAKLIFGDMWA